MTAEIEDHLAHYGKLGMKWGKHRAAVAEKNATIDGARARQAVRKSEVDHLTAKRIATIDKKGKAHLDNKIADKNFELKNNPDARQAAQLKTGEKWVKGVKVAGLLSLSVVGLGVAASIIDKEMDKYDNSPERLDKLNEQLREQGRETKSEGSSYPVEYTFKDGRATKTRG